MRTEKQSRVPCSHVAAHMFHKCILGEMGGATRILVTHRVDLLRKVPRTSVTLRAMSLQIVKP
jgi:hypothetical protein